MAHGYVHLHSRIGVNPNSLGENHLLNGKKNVRRSQQLVRSFSTRSCLLNSLYLNEPTDFNLTVQTPDKYFVEAGTDIPAHIKEQEISITVQEEKLRETSSQKSSNDSK